MSIEDLISSYDYDYYDGTVNVTTFDDYMIDSDSDSINDTLIINLSTDAESSHQYYVIVHLEDQTLITNYSNTTLSNTTNHTFITFPTELLTQQQYNYTVEIRDEDFGLAYEKHHTQTQLYPNYETGLELYNITDTGNIRITLTFNVTRNTTENITAHLTYDNTTMSETTQATLTTPTTTINIDINNETIKRTHHQGTFHITSIQTEQKTLSANHTTNTYDYEDYAQTSYIKNTTTGTIDEDENNLTDILQANITINAKTTEDHTIFLTLHDPNLEPVTTLNTTVTLTTGEHTIPLNISGEDIYKTYQSGTFTISTITLNSSTSNDSITRAATLDLTYAEFEPPARPDLTLTLNQTGTNTTITVTNNGTAPAYNIIIDLFDDQTYENQTTIQSLNVNQTRTASFIIPSTNTLLTAIVDLNNIIDEENETNNIANNIASNIDITLQQLTTGSTRTIEAKINNTGNQPLQNFTWTADLGDTTIIQGAPINLTADEFATILIEHTYAPGQQYTININTTNNSLTAQDTLEIDLRFLKIHTITELTSNTLTTVYEATIGNDGDTPMQETTWTLTTNGTTITANNTLNINTNENTTLLIEHTYPGYGTHTINLTIQNNTQRDEWISTVSIAELAISNLALLHNSGTLATTTYTITEQNNQPQNATWTYDTNDTGTIQGTELLQLQPNENITILIQNNHTTTGTYQITAGANTSTASYTNTLNVTIS